MRETFECMDCDKAIEKLQRLKKENKKRKVIVCTIDFDSDEESTKITTPEDLWIAEAFLQFGKM